MQITLATHYGMCFGVRDAIKKTHELASAAPVTILGQLVHNPIVREELKQLGVVEASLERSSTVTTPDVVITAHGASDNDRSAWRDAGYRVTDTTCPLVRKAHTALAQLVASGAHPVIIGQVNHVEVRGLAGDFSQASIVENESDVTQLPAHKSYGIVSQTTQPIAKVHKIVAAIRANFPDSEVVFRDTVCQPTKDRQAALEGLCKDNEVVIVVGGRNSNNTRQLMLAAEKLGARAFQVEHAGDLRPAWIEHATRVGLTAGTSTLETTVQEVHAALKALCDARENRS